MTIPFPPEDSLPADPPTKVAPEEELTSPFAGADGHKLSQRKGELPAHVGRYAIDEELGCGGMGVVYRGRDASLNRSLAIKVLRPEHQGNAGLKQRFLEEAQIMGQLQHPGVAPIHEIGQLDDGRPFFSMKQIKGQTLAELLGSQGSGVRGQESAACGLAQEIVTPQAATPTTHHSPLTTHQTTTHHSTTHPSTTHHSRHLTIFEQVCQAIAYAHSRGIIHRDLKPDNIMVGAFGEVQVMDWGLAKVLTAPREEGTPPARETPPASTIYTVRSGLPAGAETALGTVLGTPAYMAPEQARGEIENLDERCDVFGLGAILCEILTDQPPFPGDTQHDSHRKAMKGDLQEALARLDGCGADAELVQLAKHCLAAEREARPRDAGEVTRAMAQYQATVQQRLRQAEIERAAAQVKAEEERKRRKVSLVLAGVVVVSVLVAAGAAVWYFQDQAFREAEEAGRQAKLAERKEQLEKTLTREFAGIEKQRAALLKKLGNALEASELLSDMDQWRRMVEQSRESWKRAAFLVNDGRELLDGSWSAQLKKLDQQITADERDLAWGKKLDKIREQADTLVGGQWQPWKVRDEYPGIFLDMKLDVVKGNLDQLAQEISGSPLRYVLVSALDHWADNYPTAKELPIRLMELARLVDPDDWRDKVRNGENWDDVEKLQELARSAKPEKQTPQIMILLGRRLLWKESKEAAAALTRKALLHYPSDYWLHFQLGSLVKGTAEEGGCYRAALAVRPKSAAAHNNLGHVLFQQKDHDGAVAHFDRAIQLDPNYARAYYNLGVLRYQQKDLKEAIEKFNKALELDPKMVDAHINLGTIQYDKKDLDGAVKHFRTALELDPKNISAHINLGAIHYSQKNLDEW